jgi:hypothetical protein
MLNTANIQQLEVGLISVPVQIKILGGPGDHGKPTSQWRQPLPFLPTYDGSSSTCGGVLAAAGNTRSTTCGGGSNHSVADAWYSVAERVSNSWPQQWPAHLGCGVSITVHSHAL